ncbi:serine hydrolase [Rapidithrix thailandica]|uniref:Serine hydrolase n=1 Tax=Rapidithrix thailandica TaxID=413964 RepID=A0AAW9RXJ1_9BACT
MYKRIKILLLTLLPFLYFSCDKAATQQQEAPKSTLGFQVESFFDSLYQRGQFNGAVLVADQGNVLFKKGYGIANFESNTPFATSTPMEVASVSKQFTAMAVMILKDQGKLTFDDDINRFFTPSLPYSGVKVRHLLTHTSGLPDYEDHFKKHWPPNSLANNKDIVAYFHEQRPDISFAPGQDYHYSNTGYVLLAEIVHQASGMPLDKFLNQYVFQPSGMQHTGFWARDAIFQEKNYAPGFMFNPTEGKYVRPETLPGKDYYYYLSARLGPGRLSSTVEDLLRWDSVLYTNTLVSEATIQEAFTPFSIPDKESDYGFGWHIYQDSTYGKVVYHSGSWAGNLAYIKRYVDANKTFIILNNNYLRPYSKKIRAAVDSLLCGREYALPKLSTDLLLQKEIKQLPAEEIQAWLDQRADPNHYDINWKRLHKLSQQIEKAGWVDKTKNLNDWIKSHEPEKDEK